MPENRVVDGVTIWLEEYQDGWGHSYFEAYADGMYLAEGDTAQEAIDNLIAINPQWPNKLDKP